YRICGRSCVPARTTTFCRRCVDGDTAWQERESRMQKRSLIRQVVAIVLTAQILCAVVLSVLALVHERSTRLRAFDVRLQGHSDSLLGAIQDAEDPEDNVTIDPR